MSASFVLGPDPSWTAPLGRPTDPRDCRGCVIFQAFPRIDDLRVTGYADLPLTVTPLGPGGHISAHLARINADGILVLSTAAMDLRFAQGDGISRPVVAGQPMLARMQFDAIDVVLHPGDRLVLVIGQADVSPGQPNIDIGQPMGIPAAIAQSIPSPASEFAVRLEVGGEASRLVLHSFERPEAAFFDAPPLFD